MTEPEARQWVRDRYGVSRETRLAAFLDLLLAESTRQNLIAQSTLHCRWARHIVDSAQLLDHAAGIDGLWVDIGSGAGLPGVVIALLRDDQIVLVEPRSRRADFLTRCVEGLGLSNATVVATKIERWMPSAHAAVISARAVAPLPELLSSAAHFANRDSLWVLPKGRNAESEVAAARRAWQGVFHVKPSLTEAESGIVIARGVAPR